MREAAARDAPAHAGADEPLVVRAYATARRASSRPRRAPDSARSSGAARGSDERRHDALELPGRAHRQASHRVAEFLAKRSAAYDLALENEQARARCTSGRRSRTPSAPRASIACSRSLIALTIITFLPPVSAKRSSPGRRCRKSRAVSVPPVSTTTSHARVGDERLGRVVVGEHEPERVFRARRLPSRARARARARAASRATASRARRCRRRAPRVCRRARWTAGSSRAASRPSAPSARGTSRSRSLRCWRA